MQWAHFATTSLTACSDVFGHIGPLGNTSEIILHYCITGFVKRLPTSVPKHLHRVDVVWVYLVQ